jgi:nicotinamide-nucleotide amidase
MSALECCVDPILVREARETLEHLKTHRRTVVTAESCTGGLIAALLSHAPGASDCLQGEFVTYTKEHKASALGVSRSILDRRGSVNPEVAGQMAHGALERSKANLALAVTGVLGPEPDEDGNPPGCICLAVAGEHRTPVIVTAHYAQMAPDAIRRAVILRSFALLREAAS